MFITMAHVLNALEIDILMKKLAGKASDNVYWVDITGQEQKSCELGIVPVKALTELRVKDENEQILSEMEHIFC